jgi:PqqA peptide cyclase
MRLIDEISLMGPETVILTGGEPLLRSDLAFLVSYIRSRRMSCNLITNGIRLNAGRLRELCDAGLNGLTLSVDTFRDDILMSNRGISAKRIEAALNTIAAALRNGTQLRVMLSCVITKNTIGYLADFALATAQRYGSRISVSFQLCNSMPTTRHDIAHMLPSQSLSRSLQGDISQLIQLKSKGISIINSVPYLKHIPRFLNEHKMPKAFCCTAGFAWITIGPKLQLLPCWNLKSVGDLNVTSLREAWNSSKYNRIRLNMLKGVCPKCWTACYHWELPPFVKRLRLRALGMLWLQHSTKSISTS